MDTHRNPAVASEIPADFQPELLPSPPKTTWEDFFSRQYMEEEEDGEKDSLQWLSIFMEDCLSGTTISALPPASSTSSSFQIPTHSHPSNSPSKSRNTSGRKKMKTNSNFINYSNQSPLLHQKHWLADSELLITPKLDKAVNLDGGDSTTSSQPKRCSHCLSQRTPQWRAGPTGPKTLCNACGMRFKTGRLLPEYRPAKSPSFVSYKHSNSHKKVMEMRMAVQSPNFH